jgi:hypothetical protein
MAADTTHVSKIQKRESGDLLAIASGGVLDIESGAAIKIAGTQVTSSAAELNILDGVTASAAEINLIDGAVAGTAVASKALALGANKEVDEIHTAKLYLGAAAGTEITSNAAELNSLDGVTHPVGGTVALRKIAGGEYTVVQGDDDANVATIATGLTTVTSAIVQVVTAGNAIGEGTPPDAVIAFAAGNVTVGDGATFAVTAGQKIRWIAFGE